MASLGEFNKRMKVTSLAIEGNVDKIVKKLALKIDSEVVIETPVDTGRARSAWVVGISAANRSKPDFTEGKKKSTKSIVTREAIDRAKQTILARKKGQTIIISNNVNYIGDLNDGTSAQAPEMFVQMAIKRGINAVKGIKVLKI